MSKNRFLRHASVLLLVAVASTAGADNSRTTDGLSLQLIMQDPDWIGNSPVNAYWSLDGDTIYFQRERNGEEFLDQYAVQLGTGQIAQLDAAAQAGMPGPRGQYSRDGTRRVYLKDGDIFIAHLDADDVQQITRTAASEAAPFFMADDRRIAWRDGNTFFIFDPASGLVEQAVELKTEDDPAAEEPGFDYLKDQQTRLFSTLREDTRQADAERAHEHSMAAGNPARMNPAIHLGSDVEIRGVSLSPAGRYLLVVTVPAKYEQGRQDSMPNYVAADGYVNNRDVRPLVGLDMPAPQSLHLVDLDTGAVTRLKTDGLPGIKDDPLEDLRDDALEYHVKNGGDRDLVEKALKAPDVRDVEFEGIAWTRDGLQAAVQAHSVDNKDRWIATVDFGKARLESQHRLHDDAWINWYFNEFGWLPDNETLWYLSEESGYSHLYVKQPGERAKALTKGDWEVSSPFVNRDGSFVYFLG
ncbi:MAG TPA: DPP IV N-terminal domain-containing protein, partial [Gammaproteobacteria bacterium]